jgi:hypothetical protein
MGPMVWSRLDGRIIDDKYVATKYFGVLSEDNYRNMLEEIRVARKWNLTIEEFNEWMDSPTDDMAYKYFHDIHCDCRFGAHIDNILWSMGAVGAAHIERENMHGSDWPAHNAGWSNSHG